MTDPVGQRFGALTVTGPVERGHRGAMRRAAACDCGGGTVDYLWNLRRNVSCGCHRAKRMGALKFEHGHNRKGNASPTHRTWQAMIARCENPEHENFKNYGGRGIAVCPAWRASFAAFLVDMGERPAGMTIDRLDNDKGYEPGNCRWATAIEQRANRRDMERVNV